MTEQAVSLNPCEQVVKMLWPEWTLGKCEYPEGCLVLTDTGAHRYFWLTSFLDIREMERKVMADEAMAKEYGRALHEAWWNANGRDHCLWTSVGQEGFYADQARLATASTEVRAKALVALAQSRAK